MFQPALFLLVLFLLIMLGVYLWASQRNLIKNRALTPKEYFWKLKQISDKSEYELFHIAAEEKGWPEYQVERHFRRYLEDQSLPIYVQQFIEDGKAYIEAYRPMRGNFFDKKVLLFFSLFSMLVIGGSFIFCLYIFPRIFPYGEYDPAGISKIARPHIFRAIFLAEKRQYEKACFELKQACELGECKYYNTKKRDGICQ
jgi:hypothetical protein